MDKGGPSVAPVPVADDPPAFALGVGSGQPEAVGEEAESAADPAHSLTEGLEGSREELHLVHEPLITRLHGWVLLS